MGQRNVSKKGLGLQRKGENYLNRVNLIKYEA